MKGKWTVEMIKARQDILSGALPKNGTGGERNSYEIIEQLLSELAESQKSTARECAEIAEKIIDAQDWGYEGDRGIALKIEMAIEKQFNL